MAVTPPVRPLRVLVVDDCADTTESLRILLGLWGHEARTARGGPEALATAAAFLPEVVLLDLGLPGLDGCEVARRLRQLPGLNDAFLIAMTGYTREQDRAGARAAGFDLYLTKPFDPEQLERQLLNRATPLPC